MPSTSTVGPVAVADIRTLALVGPAGAGKTLLAESLLAASGAISSAGTLERGSTVSDFDPLERPPTLPATACRPWKPWTRPWW